MSKKPRTTFGPLPGVPPFDQTLIDRFAEQRLRRGTAYEPRTRHLQPDGWASYTNRLFLESSPYLLQHAHNPVNWFPWGDEAFALAKELQRPVLVSIGYATCHWCHVMEEESFEDEEIARQLNENFIAVKVDREERPDLDAVYMAAVQALTGSGGWPLNVWLTPERQPFYGGTYFPPRDGQMGRGAGFLTLLRMLRDAYDREPAKVAETGRQLTQVVRQTLAPRGDGAIPPPELLRQVIASYRSQFDAEFGGIGMAPKFPSSLPLRLLFRVYRHTGDESIRQMADLTLQKMADGGIYDQVGGGFHRYATDRNWLTPHFEKMLYDNALLANTYLEGYQVTGNMDYLRLVREILCYLQRDMAAPDGGFFAATDADSLTPAGHREEGYAFTWTIPELTEALGTERARLAIAYWAVTEQGNFEGRNILQVPRPPAEVARQLGLTEESLEEAIGQVKELLYAARRARPQPLRDEKILADWNGLAISAFARAGLLLGEPAYVVQAQKTARFILDRLVSGGTLAHSYQEGAARGSGFLDDYAFMIAGLLDLFEATGDPAWLQQATDFTTVVTTDFADPRQGGFFMTGKAHEELLAREKPAYDGVVPSGNSVMIMNLLRLSTLTEEPTYGQQAELALQAFGATMSSSAAARSEMLMALDWFHDTPLEIVIVTPQEERETAEPLLQEFRRLYLPNRVLIVTSAGQELAAVARLVPLLRDKTAAGGKATAYVCANRSCRLATSDPKPLAELLREG